MDIRTKRSPWLAPLVAIAIAGVVLPTGAAAADHPTVLTRTVQGPLTIPRHPARDALVTRHLPSGRWLVWARVHTSGDALVTCRLAMLGSTEGDAHRVRVRADGWSMWLAVSGHTSRSAGLDVELSCDSGGEPGITADRIRIVALRVADLRRVDMRSGNVSSVGHASPRAIQGRRAAAIDVPSASTPQTIARVRLPAGRWWLTATVGLRAKPGSGGGAALSTWVRCQLSGEGRIDSVADSVGRAGAPYDQESHALHGVAVLEHTTNVTLRCNEPVGEHGPDIEARDLRVTALKLGTLTSGRPPVTLGKATPKASHDAVNGVTVIPAGTSWTTIAQRPLRAGRWFVTGNVSPTAAECRIRLGAAVDGVPDWTHPMTLVRTTSTPSTVRLECRSTDGPGEVRQARLTAIGVAPLRVR